MYACKSGNKEIVELLLKYKANPAVSNNIGDTCETMAFKSGNSEIMMLLKGKKEPSAIKSIDSIPPLSNLKSIPSMKNRWIMSSSLYLYNNKENYLIIKLLFLNISS
mgnify:CR=1 FL=1